MPKTEPVGDRPTLSPFQTDAVATYMWRLYLSFHELNPEPHDPVLCECFQSAHQAVRQMLWRGKELVESGWEDRWPAGEQGAEFLTIDHPRLFDA